MGVKKSIKAAAASKKPKAEVGPSQRITRSTSKPAPKATTKAKELPGEDLRNYTPPKENKRGHNIQRTAQRKKDERNASTKAKATGKAQRGY